jgi:hypothetical protein
VVFAVDTIRGFKDVGHRRCMAIAGGYPLR